MSRDLSFSCPVCGDRNQSTGSTLYGWCGTCCAYTGDEYATRQTVIVRDPPAPRPTTARMWFWRAVTVAARWHPGLHAAGAQRMHTAAVAARR